MNWRGHWLRPIAAPVALAAAVVTLPGSLQRPLPAREDAYRANNRGVAELEQYNYDAAVKSFRRALELSADLDIARLNLSLALLYAGAGDEALATARQAGDRLPALPQSYYAAGLAARSLGRTEEALAAFKKVLELDPEDVGSRVNEGQVYLQQRQYVDAATLFREALQREPHNVTAAYGLATALTRSGSADAPDAMRRFEALRDQPYGVTYTNTYLEQGRYGEAIASTGAEPELVDPSPPAVTFTDATADVLPNPPTPPAATASTARSGSVMLFDADNDGDLDALLTDSDRVRFYINTSGILADATDAAGLRSAAANAHAAVAADYDNDGRPDLLLLTSQGLRLLRRTPDGRHDDVTRSAGFPRMPDARSAAFVDVDHDGDVDIVVAGATTRVLRNNGNSTFTDVTAAARIEDTPADAIAIAPTDYDDRRDVDFLILGSSGAPRLFQNMRDGSFRDVATEVGLPAAARFGALAAADVNKDGYPDFFFGRSEASGVFALSDGHGHFTIRDAPAPTGGATTAQFVDYDNDGLLDLITASTSGLRLLRNMGTGWSDVTGRARLDTLAQAAGTIRSITLGDVDGDGDTDALVFTSAGTLRFWRNAGSPNRSLLVRLAGKVSNRGGVGSKVDLRAGSLRQRFETSAVTPPLRPADLLFGLGPRPAADVVRVIWPSGTLQAETTGDSRAIVITELDRKPSSCPYLYVWNGSRFEFVTDFMGGGEMGHWEAPGVWSTPDPDEYVRIAPGRLAPKDGRYELRVTNELEETLFVDRLQLVAVDHAEKSAVFPNEGLGSPGSGRFQITTTRGAHPPRAAFDEHGHDVLSRIALVDRQYPDDFVVSDIRGYAGQHDLVIDVGAPSSALVLLATGWTDYAFSADNVAAYQRGMRLMLPRLDAKSSSGAWRTVIANIGIPVGRPQTVVIDLRGKLQPGEHELRIRTNMRIYWDQILVDTSGGAAPVRITRLDAAKALLHWRGFSAEMSPDGREPVLFDYDRVSPSAPWKTMIGRYTREGDVRDLLNRVDDMFVIARPGDEIALSFDAAALPGLTSGQARTFLLYADGFTKEMDISSASPDTVLPLPFHAMRRYPYGDDEHYPSGAAYRDYRDRYNTRTVSRPVPPVETATGR